MERKSPGKSKEKEDRETKALQREKNKGNDKDKIKNKKILILVVLPDNRRKDGTDNFPVSKGTLLLPPNECSNVRFTKNRMFSRRVKGRFEIDFEFGEEVILPRNRVQEVSLRRRTERIRHGGPGAEDNLAIPNDWWGG